MRRHHLPALLPLLALHAAATAQSLDMLLQPNAGVFEAPSGQGPGGPGGALITRLQAVSGIRLNQRLEPLPRALLTIEQVPGSCVVGVNRTPEREARYLWAGPLASGAIAIYGRGDESRRIASPEDLSGARLVVQRNSTTANWLREHSLAAQEVNETRTGLRMLQAGRVDYWVVNDIAAYFAIRGSEGTAPRLLYSFGRLDLYIACHLGTDAALVAALDAAITRLRHAGELAEFGLR